MDFVQMEHIIVASYSVVFLFIMLLTMHSGPLFPERILLKIGLLIMSCHIFFLEHNLLQILLVAILLSTITVRQQGQMQSLQEILLVMDQGNPGIFLLSQALQKQQMAHLTISILRLLKQIFKVAWQNFGQQSLTITSDPKQSWDGGEKNYEKNNTYYYRCYSHTIFSKLFYSRVFPQSTTTCYPWYSYPNTST